MSGRLKLNSMARRLRRLPGFAALELTVLGRMAWITLRLLRLCTRLEFHGLSRLEDAWQGPSPVVMAFWHGRVLMLPFLYRGNGAYVMNSTHRDGEIIARAIAGLGIGTTRGSSSRRAVAGALGLFRALKAGHDVALIPDGPRGPAGKAKPGVVGLAMSAGAPIYPLAFSARRAIRLNGWDRMMIPVPGTTVVCVAGEPLDTAALPAGKATRTALLEELERRLDETCRMADRIAGRVEEGT